MNDEEFKALRHRFWRLGKERRFTVIQKIGFMSMEPFSGIDPVTRTEDNPNGKPYDPQAERVQREMLFYIKNDFSQLAELISLIEVEEAQITVAEEKAEYLRPPPIREVPPSKEELDAMRYVPGVKKEI